MVTTDLGVQFLYTNQWGGGWAMDPMNPYNVSLVCPPSELPM
jgi:hypothetical protein